MPYRKAHPALHASEMVVHFQIIPSSYYLAARQSLQEIWAAQLLA